MVMMYDEWGLYIYMYIYLYIHICIMSVTTGREGEGEGERERERVPNNKARSTCGQFQQHTQTAVLLSCIEEKSQKAPATNNASHVNAVPAVSVR